MGSENGRAAYTARVTEGVLLIRAYKHLAQANRARYKVA